MTSSNKIAIPIVLAEMTFVRGLLPKTVDPEASSDRFTLSRHLSLEIDQNSLENRTDAEPSVISDRGQYSKSQPKDTDIRRQRRNDPTFQRRTNLARP